MESPPDSSVKPRSFIRERRLRRVILIVLLPFLCLVLFLLYERVRGGISLAHYRRELIAKGETISPRDLASPPSTLENGAPQIAEYIRQLTEGPILPKRYPPKMKLTPAGRAVIGFRENVWVEDKRTNH